MSNICYMKYQQDINRAHDKKKVYNDFLKDLRQKKPKDLDDKFHRLHDEVFEEINCLECANCCKTTSPIILMSDIEKLAKVLKMKSSEIIETYLKIDDEGDYVFKSAPCPFLGMDNKCLVYKNRPKACREYPHTNRKNMYQIMSLTAKNTLICPAVSRIIEKLHNHDLNRN